MATGFSFGTGMPVESVVGWSARGSGTVPAQASIGEDCGWTTATCCGGTACALACPTGAEGTGVEAVLTALVVSREGAMFSTSSGLDVDLHPATTRHPKTIEDKVERRMAPILYTNGGRLHSAPAGTTDSIC